MHDCRGDSDILYHNLGIALNSVFDTQVGYAVLKRQQQRVTPLPVSLNTLLRIFTGIVGHQGEEIIMTSAAGIENEQKSSVKTQMIASEAFWLTRPMTDEMIYYASNDVLLLPLVGCREDSDI